MLKACLGSDRCDCDRFSVYKEPGRFSEAENGGDVCEKGGGSKMLKLTNVKKTFNAGTVNEKVALSDVTLTVKKLESLPRSSAATAPGN